MICSMSTDTGPSLAILFSHRLVEVIRTTKTSNDTFDSLYEVAKRMGKTPVACIDSPG